MCQMISLSLRAVAMIVLPLTVVEYRLRLSELKQAPRTPDGWKVAHSNDAAADDLGYEPLSGGEKEVDIDARTRA